MESRNTVSVSLHNYRRISLMEFSHSTPLSSSSLSSSWVRGFNYTMNVTQITDSAKLSFESDSLGYKLSIVAIFVLATLHGVYWVHRLVRCNMLKDNKVYIPEDQMTQRGFIDSKFGFALKFFSYLYVMWLQTVMIMAIIGHYEDQWPFDLSLPKGSVGWDSFTRVFLAAWLASIIIAVLNRMTRHRMTSFYLRPSSLSAAKYIKVSQVVTDRQSSEHDLNVLHEEVVTVETKPMRHINFLLNKLVWSDAESLFVSPRCFGRNGPLGTELENIRQAGGCSNAVAADRIKKLGRNEITLQVPPLWRMLLNEVTSLFYIYQLATGCLLSLYWDYITAGILVFILVVVSALIKASMERREKLQLKSIATLHGSVWVKRDEHWTKVTSEELVVGDLICVSTDSLEVSKDLTVDCVVVRGSCVVDESALTGETMPVQKFECPKDSTARPSESGEAKKYYLFAGTTLLQGTDAPDDESPGSVSNGAIAVVTAVGANTLRGELIRRMLFGSSIKSPFWSEFIAAITILMILALGNFVVINSSKEFSMGSILPAITSIVGLISPLLTVALLGGELRSAQRLRAAGIHSRDVHRLTIAGKADLVLLDKTRTVTKSGLEFRGVVPASSLRLTECSNKDSPIGAELSACIALAHTVSRCNGEMVGHQVELRMVEVATKLGWKFGADMRAPTDPAGNQWEVERCFPFSHETMTMSAVVRQVNSGQRLIVCKGSFEALQNCCRDISQEMKQAVGIYAQEGCFILGVAMRLLAEDSPSAATMTRKHVEAELSFLGLLLYRNEVKPDSEKSIAELVSAGIEVSMITGDSVFTGTFVARAVGMIPQSARVVIGVIDDKTKLIEWRFADTDALISEDSLAADTSATLCISGDVYEQLKIEDRLNLDRIKVFGRVSPGQKAEIVRLHAALRNKTVVMCGDGANDSVALRAAHAGLAINSKAAEASVAAPFSSDSDSLSSLVLLVREARAALCTSLASYRYLVAVGIVQTLTKVVLLLQCGGFLSGVACLFIDCLLVPLMMYAICSALPAAKLAPSPPEGSLLGPEMILGTIWSIISVVVFFAIAEAVMDHSDWFVPFVTDAPLSAWRQRTDSFESALIVIVRMWTYIDLALVYSYGSVHRQALFKNWRLVSLAVFFFAVIGWLLFGPVGFAQAAFIVQVNKEVALSSVDTFLNYFLFYYERVGGVWSGITDSIEFPMNFRIGLIAILASMSLVHHLGYKLAILGPVTKFFHEKIGWRDGSCGCCGRRRPKGYRALSVSVKHLDALDESIANAGEQESPAAEWELRRTYGRWRAPTETEYN